MTDTELIDFLTDIAKQYEAWFAMSAVTKFRAAATRIAELRAQVDELVSLLRTAEADMRERAAMVLDNGRFLHDNSPAAVWAKDVAKLIRALPLSTDTPKKETYA